MKTIKNNTSYLKRLIQLTGVFLLTGLVAQSAFGQLAEPEGLERRKSPLSIARVKHADTYIKITYSRPIKRGRDIFGGLVPYGKVWRTGANEATEITVTKPITFAGKKVEAGTYTVFTIPGKEKWTIILNNVLGQWGAFDYNKKKDYLRVEVPSKKLDKTIKPFTIEFTKPKENKTTLVMKWDQTQVQISLKF